MIRIFFSLADLARVRLVGPSGPEIESAFALAGWQKNTSGYFRMWHRTVLSGILRRTELQRLLQHFVDSGTTAQDAFRVSAPEGTRTRLHASSAPTGTLSARELATLLDGFARLAVVPYWNAVRARLDRVTDVYRQIMSASGVEALLLSLHPRIHWHAPVLEIEGDDTAEIELGGRGLLVCPSLFQTAPGTLLPAGLPHPDDAAPMLVFPVRPDPRNTAPLGAGTPETPMAGSAQDALAMLVGRTRAAMLKALLGGRTNGELAGEVGVSAAAVSQHTSVLRAAGLIDTHRNRNLVLHTLTPLGRCLMGGEADSGARVPSLHSSGRLPQT